MRAPPSKIIVAPLCCVCSEMRRNDNNWWRVDVSKRGLLLTHARESEPIIKGKWYCCGTKCVLALVNEYVEEAGGGKPLLSVAAGGQI